MQHAMRTCERKETHGAGSTAALVCARGYQRTLCVSRNCRDRRSWHICLICLNGPVRNIVLSSESKQPSQQSAVKSERPRSHSCPTSYHPTAHSTHSTVVPEYQARSDIPGGRGRLKTNHKALVLRAEASDRYIQLGATRGWLAGRADRSVPRSHSRSKVRRAPDRLQQRANCRYHGMEQRAGRGSLVQSAERTADECRYAEERPERNERAGQRERAKPI
jgi:hypothetical protein